MPYHKFNTNEVFSNTILTHPTFRLVIYSGSSYYNNAPNISGAFADPIRLTDAGHISLYELNVDRVSSSTGRWIGPRSPSVDQEVIDNGLIYSFVVKNSSRIDFRTSTEASFNNSNYGDIITSTYPLTSSVTKEYYSTATLRSGTSYVSHLLALKNTINYYRYLNPVYQYSSSVRNLDDAKVGLVNIPSIFYGSSIKKGTIDLKYYITGTLVGRATDENRDGSIYSVYGVGSGSIIGFALYNEGFLILTASDSLSTTAVDAYTSSVTTPAGDAPAWVYFAQSISGAIMAPSSSYIMDMSGTARTNTITMFLTAPKGKLNQSNNPTFVEYSTGNFASSGSKSYIEGLRRPIKNIVSSSYIDPTGSFEKTTYISKIGVYDKERNLIGIAKLATPVRKTAARDFTFKIKVDI
tara:strand:+ start:496 stop:1722 length:1227 start_codon:yes stop_codon:yes gene_type:complete